MDVAVKLLTGATGIVGSHVALALLKDNARVRALKRKNSDVSKVRRLFRYYGEEKLFESITWVDGELDDMFAIEDALQGVTEVYHCAGLVSFSNDDRDALYKVNEEGTRNVVNACLANGGIEGFCHVSSLATINNAGLRKNLGESVFWKSTGDESHYAISKYNAEREVWRAMEEGLKAVIVNPGVVISPAFRGQSSSRLFDTCRKGNLFYTRGSTAYITAADVARVMIWLMKNRRFGERYIVAEGNHSYREIFSRIQRNFGKRAPAIEAGPLILRAGLAAETVLGWFGRKPVLTRALIRSALNTQKYELSKFREVTGIEPENVLTVIDDICARYDQAL